MPSRILRQGILSSRRVDKLSLAAEVFYRRLQSVVDDFGRFEANAMLLRSSCYPLRFDRVSDLDIAIWLKECMDADLLMLYTCVADAKQKTVIQVQDFGQQMRSKPKYPEYKENSDCVRICVADAKQLLTNVYLGVVEVVVEVVSVGAVQTRPKTEKTNLANGFELPDWIPVEHWEAWIEMRKKARKAPTDFAKKTAISTLLKLQAQGHAPADVLAQSVFHSWTGLFPIKAENDGHGFKGPSGGMKAIAGMNRARE